MATSAGDTSATSSIPADSASGASRSRISRGDRVGAHRRRVVGLDADLDVDEIGEVVEQLDRAAGLAADEGQVLVVARRRRRRASPRRSRRSPAAARAARAAARRRDRRACAPRRSSAATASSSSCRARSRQSSRPSIRASTSSSACSSAAELARLAVVQAERPVARAVGEHHVAGAEGEDVPVDAEARAQLLPVVLERRHLARVGNRVRRLAEVDARAEARLVRDRDVPLEREVRARLSARGRRSGRRRSPPRRP